MQQDKFEQTLNCMTKVKQISSESANKTPEKISILSLNTNAIVPMTPNSFTKSVRGKHRFGTAAYWKYMYDQSQIIHQEIYSKCLQLEEIPGVLTVNRVKLKECLKHKLFVRLMSMVLWKPSRSWSKYNIQRRKKKRNSSQNIKQRDLFYKCKLTCIWDGICDAKV